MSAPLGLALLLLGAPPEEAIVIDPGAAAPSSVALWARWTEHLVTHTTWDEGEAGFVAGSTLTIGLDWTPKGDVEGALEVRLRHRLFVTKAGDVSGELLPEARRAVLRWYLPHGPELGLGLDVVRWGRTLARPFDVLAPIDWRDGPLGPEGGERLPVFAATLRQPLGAGEALLWWAPFYFPALLPSGPAGRAPTQDLIGSSELATKLTQRLGDLDLGVGYALVFDRPRVSIDVAPERQHVLGLELALATGVLRWAAEAALLVDQRRYRPDLTGVSAPALRWAFDVAAAPWLPVDLTVGLEGFHALAGGGARTLLEGPDDLWLRARLMLLLAFDGVLRLDVDARAGLLRDDWFVTPVLGLRASRALGLSLGLVLHGGATVDAGLGALYDRADHVFVRASMDL